MSAAPECDLAIVGGGLAGCLTAYAISVARPTLNIMLIEPEAVFGGNHVWSYFASDIAAEDRWIVEPFVDHSWTHYDVHFPDFARTFDNAYHAIRSQRFDTAMRSHVPADRILRAAAVDVQPDHVVLDDQRVVRAKGVIDARGGGNLSAMRYGWQKFIGREFRTSKPHGVTRPMVMDASVAQIDGYRFVYVLPFADDRLFIEDTYYSDGPEIDRPALNERIDAYAAAHGWDVAEVVHEEIGALPVTTGGDVDALLAGGGDAAKIGVRAGLFHPTTGFSLPDAVRVAAFIARLDDLSGASLATTITSYAKARWAEGSYYRFLDRMLFEASEPNDRYKVLQRFYSLHPALISRFYARATTVFDKARILTGRPPVPIGRAMKVLRERKS